MAHGMAMSGYASGSEAYERGRPGYPAALTDQLLDVLDVGDGDRVLDVGAVAEALPLATASIDAALCAQTFHWLDGERALDELSRVLRPGGGLGLIWNTKDTAVAWVAEVEGLVDRIHGPTGTPRYKTGRWHDAFGAGSGWERLSTASGTQEHGTDRDQVVDRVLSSSAVAALDSAGQARVADEVRQILDRHALRGRFGFPYLTEIWWTRPAT